MLYRSIAIACVGATFLFPGVALAQEAPGIHGAVRSANGQPLAGAQIRFDGKDSRTAPITTTTNAKGDYSASGLRAGTYKISVAVNGAVKSSVNVKIESGNSRVDFELTPSAKTRKHYVWVPSDTGTHLGGRWVEVDGDATPVAGTWNTDRASGELVRNITRRTASVPSGH